MQAKVSERIQAVALRKQGLSYGEILEVLPVSQASLSLWLRDIVLTDAQKKRLFLKSREAGWKARRKYRKVRMEKLMQEVKEELPQLSSDPFFTLGLALYCAEGAKQKPWNISEAVCFGNSDPFLVLLIRKWFQCYCFIKEHEFGYRLHIHVTADIEKARKEWADILGIDPNDMTVTLKNNKITSRHVHDHYKGLIHLRVYKSTWLNRRIELWGKGVAEKYLK